MLQFQEMRPVVEHLKNKIEQAVVKNKTMTGVDRLKGYEKVRKEILQEVMDFSATEEALNPHAIIEVVKDAAKAIKEAPLPCPEVIDTNTRN